MTSSWFLIPHHTTTVTFCVYFVDMFYLILLSYTVQLKFHCDFRMMKHLVHVVQILCRHLEFIRKYMTCLDAAQICMVKAESQWKIMNVAVMCSIKFIIGFNMLKI